MNSTMERPAEAHRVDWDVSNWGVRGQVSCQSPPGARCRLVCADACGAETWPCGPEDARHQMVDGDECQVVLFIENSDSTESCYVGPAHAPLLSGPVEVSWEGDYYGWQMAAPASEVLVADGAYETIRARPHTCGSPLKVSLRWDAHACLTCGIWLEPVCGTADCDTCTGRPATPPRVEQEAGRG